MERRSAPIELLWDLVFAFAITRVTTLLANDLSWRGFGRAMLVLALVWWAWSAFVWVTNAQDPNTPSFRAALLIGSALIFVNGLALPHAFDGEAVLFAATYAGVRMLHLALYVEASRRGQASLSAIAGFFVTVSVGMALLLAGAFDESLRVPLWVAAAAIDYAGPAWLTRDRLRGLQEVAVSHFAERYSLFIIICLGESIVATGLGATRQQSLSAAAVAAVTLALVITIGLWWTYFDRLAGEAEERLRGHHDPVIAAADAYSYLHLIVVAGIIIFAVGARSATAHPLEHLPAAARLALCGGVATYMVGHVAFVLRIAGRVHYPELVTAGLSLVVFAVTGGLAAWLTVGVLALVVALLVAGEIARPLISASA